MQLRIRLVDRIAEFGAAPDEALTTLQTRGVDGLDVETLGGKQLQRAVLTLDVDGTDLGHHQAGDLAHDLVEPGLTVVRPGHDLVQAPHDDTQRGLLRRSHRRRPYGVTRHLNGGRATTKSSESFRHSSNRRKVLAFVLPRDSRFLTPAGRPPARA